MLLPEKERNNYISNLDSKGAEILLKYSKEPEKVINILGDKGKEYISNLDSGGIEDLLSYSKDFEKVINILGDKGKKFISNLDLYKKRILLKNSQYNEKFMYRLLRDKEYLKFLNSGLHGEMEIDTILLNSENPDKVLNMLGDKKDDVIDRLYNTQRIGKIEAFISNSKAPDKLLQLFDLKDEYLESIEKYEIVEILIKTKVPYKVIDAVGSDIVAPLIKSFNKNHIARVLNNAKEPDKIKEILRKYGHGV